MRSSKLSFTFLCVIALSLQFCGSTGVDLEGDTSNLNDQLELEVQTVEDNEVIETTEEEDIDAPIVSNVSSNLVSIDCAEKTAAGNPDEDYVEITCENSQGTLLYYYYCVEGTESEDGDFIVAREDSDNPDTVERLFETTLVTCQEDDADDPEIIEEDFIVS